MPNSFKKSSESLKILKTGKLLKKDDLSCKLFYTAKCRSTEHSRVKMSCSADNQILVKLITFILL